MQSYLPQRAEPQVVVPEPTPAALQYYRSGNLLWAIGTGLGLLIPAILLVSGASARLRNLTYRIGRRWIPSLLLYAILFTIGYALLTLPFAYYLGFVRQHAYGLSTQTFSKWLADWVKGVGVSAIGLALVLWIPYLLLRLSPRRWWLYAGLATAPIATFVLVISPIWIDPLFNNFQRMPDRALETRLLALAECAGIPGSRVYQVDKSVDTRTVNAYVAGVGGSKRIVLWDTMLSKLNPDQIVFVMAHEMGHFVLRHTLAVILGATLLVTGSLYVVHRVAGRLIARFGSRFGFNRLDDIASFPLLLLLGTVVSIVTSPAVLAFSRYQEHEADRFALELTRNNYAGATTFVRLQEENLSVPRPGPIFKFWRGSHPSLGDRVDFANNYRPWERGEPLRYRHLFCPLSPVSLITAAEAPWRHILGARSPPYSAPPEDSMKAHTAVPLSLAVLALTACGGGQSVEINPDVQPVASRWNGVLATPPELAGIVQVRGQAWMGQDPKDLDKTQARVDISNAVPGGQHPWHVHRGQCGSDKGIFGPADAYPPLKVEGNGRAGATAKLSLPYPKTGDYFVNVHASAKNLNTIVACGNLAPPAR